MGTNVFPMREDHPVSRLDVPSHIHARTDLAFWFWHTFEYGLPLAPGDMAGAVLKFLTDNGYTIGKTNEREEAAQRVADWFAQNSPYYHYRFDVIAAARGNEHQDGGEQE